MYVREKVLSTLIFSVQVTRIKALTIGNESLFPLPSSPKFFFFLYSLNLPFTTFSSRFLQASFNHLILCLLREHTNNAIDAVSRAITQYFCLNDPLIIRRRVGVAFGVKWRHCFRAERHSGNLQRVVYTYASSIVISSP